MAQGATTTTLEGPLRMLASASLLGDQKAPTDARLETVSGTDSFCLSGDLPQPMPTVSLALFLVPPLFAQLDRRLDFHAVGVIGVESR